MLIFVNQQVQQQFVRPFKMENIQIRRQKNKRSIESLIEESAIDNSFNYEAHELRKAFNETLMTMNAKNTEKEKEIQKLKILLRQQEQNRAKLEVKYKKVHEQLAARTTQLQETSQLYRDSKKKLQYAEYKLQNITENRNLFENSYSYEEEKAVDKRKIRNEVAQQFNKIIGRKVEYFTEEIKKYVMSMEVESKIQSFLEELIYLNPYSELQLGIMKQEMRQQYQGRIRKDDNEITAQEQWHMLEKSLEKLKEINRKRQPLPDKMEDRDRSVSVGKRRKLFS